MSYINENGLSYFWGKIKSYIANHSPVTSVNNQTGDVTLSIPTVPTSLSSFTDDLGNSPTHTHSQYLTSHQDISGKENTSNKVTSLSASSTDTEYPSAKCVWDLVGDIETILASI